MAIGGAGPDEPQLFTRDFVLLAFSAMLYYASFGASMPLVPKYVKTITTSDVLVGVVAGSFALSAVVLRPSLGRLGDRRPRRLLIIGGGLISGLAYVGHAFSEHVPMLIVFRLLVGAGQGAVMIGAASLAVDMAPYHRRGEAASYILVAFQLGMGLGPVAGELLVDHTSWDVAWYCCAASGFASAAVASLLPNRPVIGMGGPQNRRFLHPAGVRPGLVIGFGVFGFAGFNAFLALFGDDIGVGSVGPVFLILSVTTVVVRVVGARLPDRLGPGLGGAIALGCIGVGMIAIGLIQQPVALYAFALLLGVGSALMFPCISVRALNDVPENERSSSLATFTMFIDVFAGVSGLVLGGVAAVSTYSVVFVAGGAVALIGSLASRRVLAEPTIVTDEPAVA